VQALRPLFCDMICDVHLVSARMPCLGAQAVTSGANPVSIKKGIDKTCTHLVERLKEMARPVKGTEDIRVRLCCLEALLQRRLFCLGILVHPGMNSAAGISLYDAQELVIQYGSMFRLCRRRVWRPSQPATTASSVI